MAYIDKARQPDDLRFILIDDRGEWKLPHTPKGWDESTFEWKMHVEYFGLYRRMANELQFVLDGARILRRAFYRGGIEAKVTLRIDILNRKNWKYESSEFWALDFSTFSDDGTYVEVGAMDNEIVDKIQAYKSVQYEFPCDEITVRVPGIDIVDWVDYGILFDPNRPTGAYSPEVYNSRSRLVLNYLEFSDQVERESTEGDGCSIANERLPFGCPFFISNENTFIRGLSQQVSVRLHGHFNYRFKRNRFNYADYTVELVSDRGLNPPVPETINDTVAVLFDTRGRPASPGRDIITLFPDRADFDITFNALPGVRYGIYVRFHGVWGEWGKFVIGNGVDGRGNETVPNNIRVSYSGTTDSSLVKAVRPHTLFQRLVDRVNEGPFPTSSVTFGQWANLVVASGDSIRGIEEPVIKTSFDDFFNSYNSVLNLGMGLEPRMIDNVRTKVLTMEYKFYYIRPATKILDIGEVKSCRFTPATEFLYSSAVIGYPSDDYERDLGREEFNSKQEWQFPLLRSKRKLDLMSVYRADQYGIEELRIKQLTADNENEVDSKRDNNCYFLHIQRESGEDGIYDVISAEDYKSVTGISKRSSTYNLGISPKKNLLRHGDMLNVGLFGLDKDITFASADKNAELVTVDLQGNYVRENQSIQKQFIPKRLFTPIQAQVVCKIPVDMYQLIDNYTNGFVEFSYLGKKYKGFILEASQDIARNSEREFTFLLHPDANVNQIIH